jgi:hypothetical protein
MVFASTITPDRPRRNSTASGTSSAPDVPPWNQLGYGNNAIEVSYVDVR